MRDGTWHRWGTACLTVAALTLMLAGCGAPAETGPGTTAGLPEETAPVENSDGEMLAVPETVQTVLYLPNEEDSYQTLRTEEAEVANGIQGLLDALTDRGVLPEGTAALSFEITDDGETVVTGEGPEAVVSHTAGDLHGALDLSEEFLTGLETGTTGELMLMGSLVNTVIGHYQLTDLTLTCQGETIESGHQIYDEPLTFYEF